MNINEAELHRLATIFLGENKKLNLSAFRTEELCWSGNVLDSISLLHAFDVLPELKELRRMLDIGTGGGFPLLPLAISLPDVSCMGLDSIAKKQDAVQRIVDAMEINNVQLICDRCEVTGHQPSYRGTFDLVTARAVAPLPILLEYAVPFLRIGGLCAFWKSDKVAAELSSTVRAQKVLHAPFVRTYEYDLGEKWGRRTIIFFRKIRETPEEYPRETGQPKSRPL